LGRSLSKRLSRHKLEAYITRTPKFQDPYDGDATIRYLMCSQKGYIASLVYYMESNRKSIWKTN